MNHTAILFKLAKMGLSGRILGWLRSYLQDRSFKILFEGHESSVRKVTSGVPQGGILSPLLFNVLMSDFPEGNNISTSIFADDIAIYSTGDSLDQIMPMLKNT